MWRAAMAMAWIAASWSGSEPVPRTNEPIAEEAALARHLAEEVARLRAELDAVRAERDRLLERLASERLEADRWTIVSAPLPDAEPARADIAPTGWNVVDGNRDLGLIAIEAGRREGIRPGLALAIVRSGAVVARARVVEVRERIAGARVEAIAGGSFPEPGDRAVVWRMQRE